MFERVELIDDRGVEYVYVYESEQAANSEQEWIQIYERWPSNVPNWQGFMNRLDLQTENNPNGTGLFEKMLSINPVLAWQGYNLCLNFTKLPRNKVSEMEIRTLEFIYNLLSQSLDSEDNDLLTEAIEEFNIPITLNS